MPRIPFEAEPGVPDPSNARRPNAERSAPNSSDPGKTGAAPWAADKEKVWTVSQLTRQIRQVLEGSLGALAVEGEVSNFRAAASGHLYFNLKDRDAQIRCVMFRAAAQSLKFQVEDGLHVVVRGRLTVYEQRGEYQLQVVLLEPKGAGALQLAFEQLKRKLEAEGLFAAERKRPIPFLPRRVGIVTSPHGAAIRDMITVIGRRFPGMPILICPATVQGDQAAGEIAASIATLNRLARREQIDVIIVGRGGGSVEDLWAFNEEPVARAIFASKVPIVSAVGHETDFTIADFVADLRAPTPSAAAELVVPNRIDLLVTVREWRRRLFRRLKTELARDVEQWEGLRARLGSPQARLEQAELRVDDHRERLGQGLHVHRRHLSQRYAKARELLLGFRPDRQIPLHRREARALSRRLGPALRRHVRRLRERAEAAVQRLDAVSPLAVMGRGYGIVQDAQGRIVRSVDQVSVGDNLDVRLRDGSLDAGVRGVRKFRG
jgi:exodeoxyribonuclease VII large subunit